MPEESADITTGASNKEVPTKTPKMLTFSKTKFLVFTLLLVLLVLGALVGSYFLGKASVKEEVVSKEEQNEEIKEEIPDLIEADLGEEVTAKNGIAIKLEQAKHDAVFEKQKEESKSYYEKNSSQSAYLDSDYFKQSSLVLRISVTNTTDKVSPYSPSSFRLKDSKNNQYTSGFGFEGDTSQPATSNLNPGETTKLTITYIVPTAEKNFTLIYENVVIDFTL